MFDFLKVKLGAFTAKFFSAEFYKISNIIRKEFLVLVQNCPYIKKIKFFKNL